MHKAEHYRQPDKRGYRAPAGGQQALRLPCCVQGRLQLSTGMTETQLNELRIGWDLLIDIDCKWIEYSKLAARAIINVLQNHGIKAVSLKFSGSKGFHVLVPFKAFPKDIAGENIKDLFPEFPRKLVAYLRHQSQEEMKKILPEDFFQQFKDVKIKKGIKCNTCGEIVNEYIWKTLFCSRCNIQEQRKIEKEFDDEKHARIMAEKIKEVKLQEILTEASINFSDKKIDKQLRS